MALFKKRFCADLSSLAAVDDDNDHVASETKPEQAGTSNSGLTVTVTTTEHVTAPEHETIQASVSDISAGSELDLPPVQETNQRPESQVEPEPTKGSRLPPELFSRMTECFVCGETAKPGQEFIRNYGGVTCFSCRAFFRRATQSEKTRAWFCINGEKCLLTVATRLNCKKCRYLKCLDAGMLPEMVLNTDQKKHRFRRHLAKEKGQTGRSSRPADVTVNEHDMEDQQPEDDLDNSKSEDPLSSKLEMIFETFQKTIQRTEESIGKPMVAAGRVSSNYPLRDIFIEHIAEACDDFRSFANSLSQFNELQPDVQEELLSKSMPLYVQLLIVFYFTTSTGKEKFRKLLKLHPRYKLDRTKHFDEIMNFFILGTDLQFLDNAFATFRLVSLDNEQCRAVLTYVLLFDQDILNKQEDDLSSVTILNNFLFDTCLIDSEILFSLHDFRSTLTKLSIFFASNVDFGEMVTTNLGNNVHRKYIFMDYTREEETWLQNQLQLLDEAYKSVTMRQDFVHDFILYSSGKPVPPNSLVFSKQPFCERISRVFNLHEEFRALPVNNQMEYLIMNGTAGIVLVVARIELVADGIKQLQECFGVWDDKVWQQHFLPYLGLPNRIEKVYMTNHPKSGTHDVRKWIKHGQILANLAKFISDAKIFRMLLLLTLTKSVSGHQQNTEMGKLHAMYLNTIQRHLRWHSKKMATSGLFGFVLPDPNEIVDCLQSIQFLARLHMEMISQMG